MYTCTCSRVTRVSLPFTAPPHSRYHLSRLPRNLPTTVPEALRLTCSVFLALLIKYRALLKAEMGVFFPMFVLKVLETASCVPGAKDQQGITMTFNTLALVLRVVKGMTEHGQLLLDVFVNYDCDIQGAALYERTVKALVKLALGAHFKDPNAGSLSAPQVAYVRVEALSCVVRLILSHWEWLQARMPHKDGTAVAPAPSAREPAEELPVEGAGQPAAAAAQPGSPKDNSRAGERHEHNRSEIDGLCCSFLFDFNMGNGHVIPVDSMPSFFFYLFFTPSFMPLSAPRRLPRPPPRGLDYQRRRRALAAPRHALVLQPGRGPRRRPSLLLLLQARRLRLGPAQRQAGIRAGYRPVQQEAEEGHRVPAGQGPRGRLDRGRRSVPLRHQDAR